MPSRSLFGILWPRPIQSRSSGSLADDIPGHLTYTQPDGRRLLYFASEEPPVLADSQRIDLEGSRAAGGSCCRCKHMRVEVEVSPRLSEASKIISRRMFVRKLIRVSFES